MKFSMPNREALEVTFEEGEFAGQTIHFGGYGIIGGFIADTNGVWQVEPLPPQRTQEGTDGRRIREVTNDELTKMTKEILAYCANYEPFKDMEFKDFRHW